MEQTALRPKPMPGDRGGTGAPEGPAAPGRPGQHAGRGTGRRLLTALLGTLLAVVLVLSGVGLGAMGAVVIGGGGLTAPQRQSGTAPVGPSAAALSAPARSTPSASTPSASAAPPAPVAARLGVEVADDGRPGALVVGVHVPGPGFSAGLVRGDLLLAFGTARVDSAADLARAVARARPGKEVTLTVRRSGGGHRQLTAVPGILT
ncbi:PDZ domain-containing protein [Streptomyces virens]|uniref:PDZ domain-containing protein n=2 Tax=Streptomyces TaxID=1883 RepID=A0ABP6NWM4_9ACTN|nr:PDZ domain-containing protein [Streptomyces calvus]MBA8975610.1 membrane-associated protease RseP (regulator of RpoE activity) [Streptomyces calvus]